MGLTPSDAEICLKKGGDKLNPIPQDNLDRKSRKLFSAVGKNRLALAKALLQAGVTPNQKNAKGFTPLHIAALNGNSDMVNLLIRYGAFVETTDNDSNTALFHAIYSGILKVVKTFIDIHHANIEHTDRNKGTILHVACFKEYDDICDYLASRYKNKFDRPDQNGSRPVHIAAAKGNTKLVRSLAMQGFDLEATDHRAPALTFMDYAEICLSEKEFVEFRKDFVEERVARDTISLF
jgi:ankyrin repeat protein